MAVIIFYLFFFIKDNLNNKKLVISCTLFLCLLSVLIYAFKVDSWRGQWELYLNKKKSSEGDIKNYLKSQLEATSTPFENWKRTYDGFDTNYQYSDDPGAYRAGEATQQKLNDLYDKLSPDDKARADRYENK